VDLEYDVQILQVMYAHQYKELKTPRIHLALERLAHAGILDSDLSERLNAAYYFFRDLTNGLRMLRGSARDLYLPPPDSVEFGHLARRMGYKQLGRLSPRRQLYLDFESHTAAVRSFVETQFGKGVLPGRPGGNIADLLLGQPSDEQVESILGAKGFDRPATAFKNFQALYSRATHKQTFLRMAILACDFLQLKPDPDMALNNWERFAGALIRVDQHFEILQTQPKRLEMLLAIFSASQFLADLLINNPEFFDWVSEDAQINKPLDLGDWSDQLRALSRRCPLRETWLDELRRLRRRDLLRIATRDTCLGRSIVSVVAELSDLAQGVLTVALERIWDEMEEDAEDRTPILELRVCFSILAYGKLGGRELNYSSDIDIVGIHTGRYHPVYSLVMKRLCMDLTTHTAEGHAYRVDLRLRPYGHQGSVVSGVPQFLDYYRDKAQLWELQALLKARPVAGNLDIGQSALDELKKLFLVPRESSVVAESIHTLRSQMVELTGTTMHGTLDVKNGEGGIRDIEFLAQGLQLIHANRHPSLLTGNTIEALRRLHAEGLISTDDAALLGQRYIYFRRVEHFLQLLHDIQVHHLPSDEAALKALARRVQGPGSDAGRFVNELSEFMRGVRARYLSLLALG
jgi:glutamate-ammonia-ligase adenylyltransferase